MKLRLRDLAQVVVGVTVGGGFSSTASAADTVEALQTRLDFVWVLVAAALVFFMQIGFLLLEAGMVRSKNSINVAQKNFLDFMFSTLVFAVVGFMFAFGASARDVPIGLDVSLLALSDVSPWLLAFFVFQAMFCGTAATIVSGAVAERMRLSAYVACAIVTGGLIYPVFVHWAWGGALGENEGAFLGNLGFVDFAGSSVVHATGGWIALAACLVLGARKGRFGPNGEARRIAGHNPVLATAGVLILYVGWIGFNGGSTVAANEDIAPIIANTILAGAAGGAAGYILGLYRDKVALPEKALNGAIGGLVAVTAGCAVLETPGAVIIGVVGAFAALLGNDFLERRQIDDAVGAIGVHAFAGVAGVIGLALLAPAANLPIGDRWLQLGVQSLGALVNFVWSFGVGLVFFMVLRRLMPIRVGAGAEEHGLNEAEHATRLGTGHIEDAFGALARGAADLNMRLPVEPGDDGERMSRVFNALMEKLQNEELAREAAAEQSRNNAESERLSALANTTFEALCICTEDRIVDCNAAFGLLVGREAPQLTGLSFQAFVAQSSHEVLARVDALGGAVGCDIELIGSDGALIPVDIRSRELVYRGAKTRVYAMIDLRERRQAEERIRFLAQHEPLSKLPNRALFHQELTYMTERTALSGTISALLLLDLDHFKDINDLHGHNSGDEVIRTTAERLRSAIRRHDMAARLGGDEFGILLNDIESPENAIEMAQRLVEELSRPISLPDGAQVRSGASIGVAICPKDGVGAEELVQRADTALYHAKAHGRNSFALFEEGMDAEIRRRQLLETDLARAIDQDELEVYFQPRMRMSDGVIVAYEALARWPHPHKGMISPTDFISVAEHSGRIVQLGDWVLRTACQIAAHELGAARISVNVSPLQFRERNFVERIAAALQASGLAATRLELEITESLLIDDDRRAIEVLNAVKEMGVSIALDDFGTGYSSLGYLSRFPFDAIKIDRSFIMGADDAPHARAIVDAIIRLGRAMNMTIVAEGVEQLEQLQMLQNIGCDEVQGFLVGRPEPSGSVALRAPAGVRAAVEAHARDIAAGPQELAVLALRQRVEDLLGVSTPAIVSRRSSAAARQAPAPDGPVAKHA